MMHAYRLLTRIIAPLLPLWLRYRAAKGREDVARLPERFGHASLPRPAGPLLWVHAASVGESQTVLPLLERLLATYPAAHVLMTTGTVTSARLLANRPIPRLLHQFVPVDTPQAAACFLAHWLPDITFWVESEFWPTLLQETVRHCPVVLLNGRISARSAARWQLFPQASRALMDCFTLLLAGSGPDAERLRAMGGSDVRMTGNLKFSSPPLSADPAAFAELRAQIAGRPLWLAASTHPGEETLIAQAHQALSARHPGLLTLLVPRHPHRGAAVAAEMAAAGLRVSRRSLKEPITAETQLYIADTMGELGLFYRLSPLVFVGGSLVPHGGQNPFEPARLGAGVLYGPHTHNFTDFCTLLEEAGGAVRLPGAEALGPTVDALLQDAPRLAALRSHAQHAVEAQADIESSVAAMLKPLCDATLGADATTASARLVEAR